jgi:hypothetical protein
MQRCSELEAQTNRDGRRMAGRREACCGMVELNRPPQAEGAEELREQVESAALLLSYKAGSIAIIYM